MPEGESTLRYEFEPTGPPSPHEGQGAPGLDQIYINDEIVGNTETPTTAPVTFNIEGMSCGYDICEAVSHEYHAPIAFTGTIRDVKVDLSGELIADDESTVNRWLAQQ